MGLIKEASDDEIFNKHLMKIQDAIEALEKIKFEDRPVSSQIIALKVSAEDLERLAKKLEDKRTAGRTT